MPTTLSLPIALPAAAERARAEGHVVVPDATYADFAALPEGTLAQLFDGLLIMSPAPSILHQLVVQRLAQALGQYEEGLVFTSPVDVRLGPARVLQPDIVFVARERYGILGKQEIEGATDLVVEILSPSTGHYDLTRKRRIYEESGVREYWIVDPAERTIEVLALSDDGYRTAARVRGEGRVASALLDGFGVDAAKLFDWPGGA
jgi:Uma2 family endonuclease